jgi:hypothetical protein
MVCETVASRMKILNRGEEEKIWQKEAHESTI